MFSPGPRRPGGRLQRLERHALRGRCASCSRGGARRAVREVLRLLLVLDDADEPPADGGWSNPSTSTGPAGPRLLHPLAGSRTARTLPEASPATAASPTWSVPRWTSTVGDGPAPHVEPRLDDDARRVRVRPSRGGRARIGDEQDLLEQVAEVRPPLRGHLGELRRAAPVLGLEALRGEPALHGPCPRRGMSILFTATMIVTSGARVRSFVCGMTPPPAATRARRCP